MALFILTVVGLWLLFAIIVYYYYYYYYVLFSIMQNLNNAAYDVFYSDYS